MSHQAMAEVPATAGSSFHDGAAARGSRRPRSTKTVSKRRRVTLDYPQKEYAELEELAAGTLGRSTGDFVRAAVRFYRWYLQNKAMGYQLMLEKDGKAAVIDVLL